MNLPAYRFESSFQFALIHRYFSNFPNCYFYLNIFIIKCLSKYIFPDSSIHIIDSQPDPAGLFDIIRVHPVIPWQKGLPQFFFLFRPSPITFHSASRIPHSAFRIPHSAIGTRSPTPPQHFALFKNSA